MTSGKPLKVKYLTTINWKRSPYFYSSYGDPICSKRDFLWFDTTGNGKSFRNTGKTIPKKAEKPI
jgi:hypothetical protein